MGLIQEHLGSKQDGLGSENKGSVQEGSGSDQEDSGFFLQGGIIVYTVRSNFVVFSFVFWKSWRHQKVLLKLTNL